MSHAAVWGLFAAIPAVYAEYLYRTVPGSWLENWWLFIPIQLVIGYGIWQLVRAPHTTLVDAFVVWAFSTAILRVFVSVVVLREEVKTGTWIALSLLILARVVQLVWGR